MAALSAKANVPVRNPHYGSNKAAVADTFYAGGCAYLTTSGITPVSAAGVKFAGLIAETVTASVGDKIPLVVAGQFGVSNTNFNNSSVGRQAFIDVSAQSDNPADIIVSGVGTLATGDVSCGMVTAYDLDGKTWIDMNTQATPTVI